MSILPWLETFATVVETGSFTAAGNHLEISKPVVSKQISQLEQHLGVQLLHRSTRSLHLTEAGEIFTVYAQRIVADAKEAEQSIQPLQTEPQGLLRISTSQSLALSLLPNAILSFQQRYPEMALDIQVTGQFINLIEEGIDIALRAGKLDDSNMIARKLIPCPLRVFAAPSYWEQYGLPNHPNDLKTHNCLIYSPGNPLNIWRFQNSKGENIQVKVSGNLSADEGGLLLDAAINGHGVIKAPAYMAEQALKKGKLIPVLDEFNLTEACLYAVYPHSKHVSIKVRAFIDHLVNLWQNPEE